MGGEPIREPTVRCSRCPARIRPSKAITGMCIQCESEFVDRNKARKDRMYESNEKADKRERKIESKATKRAIEQTARAYFEMAKARGRDVTMKQCMREARETVLETRPKAVPKRHKPIAGEEAS